MIAESTVQKALHNEKALMCRPPALQTYNNKTQIQQELEKLGRMSYLPCFSPHIRLLISHIPLIVSNNM